MRRSRPLLTLAMLTLAIVLPQSAHAFFCLNFIGGNRSAPAAAPTYYPPIMGSASPLIAPSPMARQGYNRYPGFGTAFPPYRYPIPPTAYYPPRR